MNQSSAFLDRKIISLAKKKARVSISTICKINLTMQNGVLPSHNYDYFYCHQNTEVFFVTISTALLIACSRDNVS